jgi:lipopolysaccharide export system protein LptC
MPAIASGRARAIFRGDARPEISLEWDVLAIPVGVPGGTATEHGFVMNRLTTDYLVDGNQAVASVAGGRSDNERIFRAARRHSRYVRLLRIGIPVVLVGALLAVMFSTWITSLGALVRLPGDLGNLVISGTKITMEQPRLTGFTRDSRPYEISARAASQDITQPDTMELRELQAKMEMQDKTALRLTASRGVFHSKTDTLKLEEKILLTSSNGYEGHLTEAVVDVKRGNVVSDKPVTLKSEDGVLNANRMEVSDSGHVIRFDGGVAMVLNLQKIAEREKARVK